MAAASPAEVVLPEGVKRIVDEADVRKDLLRREVTEDGKTST